MSERFLLESTHLNLLRVRFGLLSYKTQRSNSRETTKSSRVKGNVKSSLANLEMLPPSRRCRTTFESKRCASLRLPPALVTILYADPLDSNFKYLRPPTQSRTLPSPDSFTGLLPFTSHLHNITENSTISFTRRFLSNKKQYPSKNSRSSLSPSCRTIPFFPFPILFRYVPLQITLVSPYLARLRRDIVS